jgi:hypothetical protein
MVNPSTWVLTSMTSILHGLAACGHDPGFTTKINMVANLWFHQCQRLHCFIALLYLAVHLFNPHLRSPDIPGDPSPTTGGPWRHHNLHCSGTTRRRHATDDAASRHRQTLPPDASAAVATAISRTLHLGDPDALAGDTNRHRHDGSYEAFTGYTNGPRHYDILDDLDSKRCRNDNFEAFTGRRSDAATFDTSSGSTGTSVRDPVPSPAHTCNNTHAHKTIDGSPFQHQASRGRAPHHNYQTYPLQEAVEASRGRAPHKTTNGGNIDHVRSPQGATLLGFSKVATPRFWTDTSSST